MHLRASNLHRSFGDRQILAGVSLVLGSGERVALVGPNGSGKSTLLRILAGLDQPDAGSVEVSPPTARVGFLPQSADPTRTRTAAESLGSSGTAWALVGETARLADELARSPESTETLEQYEILWHDFEAAGGEEAVERLERILGGLGLGGLTPETPIDSLSGGMRTRLAVAGLLALAPDLLLLDEPTNHLDLDALEWIEGFVVTYPGAVLIVSHDRAFLDSVARRILELDPATGTLRSYVGGYSDYAEAKEREREEAWSAYDRQQGRIQRLESNLRAAESRARSIESQTIHFHYRKQAAKVARTAVIQKRRLAREIERTGRLEKPVAGWGVKADFAAAPVSGHDALVVRGLAAGYGGQPVVEGADLAIRRGERVVIVGPNGVGKTTLLRAIVGELPPMAGEVRLGAGVVVGYFPQGQETLELATTPLELVRETAPLDETEARAYLHRFLFDVETVLKPVSTLSYGERARLILARLVLSGANLLVLDEPLSHLDLPSRESFERALLEYTGTMVAVLHDRYAIARLATRVIELT